jgi:hypothetical protein
MHHTGGRVSQSLMEGLTPASADDLPPLGELLVDDPFWPYPARGLAREGAGHLRVWATAAAAPGYLAVVTETGGIVSVTESAGRIRAGLARRYGPALVLLEHHPAPGSGEGMETLDLVRIGADGSSHWSAYGRHRRRTRGTPGWNGGWPLTGTRSSAGPRAGSIGVTTITADCPGHPAAWFASRLRGGERAPPRDGGSALSRSANVAAAGSPAARRPVGPAPPPAGARRLGRRHRRGDGRPGRDGLARPPPTGYIWPWRTGPAGS